MRTICVHVVTWSVLCALVWFGTGLLLLVLVQPVTEQMVLEVSQLHRDKLNELLPAVEAQARKARDAVQPMLGQYDRIMAAGPGAERDGLVAAYEKASAAAGLADLDMAVRRLEKASEAAAEFLDRYREYAALPAWKEVQARKAEADAALAAVGQMTRPPAALPPLPDAGVPNVVLVDQQAPEQYQVEETQEFTVTVRCNRKYTEGEATVEAVIVGPGKFLDAPRQEVRVPVNETRKVVFRYKATAKGKVNVGARVVTACDLDRGKLQAQLILHEGTRSKRYLDTKGIPTIGVGFNLQRSGAKEQIEALGLDYEKVKNGEQELTDEQIAKLLAGDIDSAIKSCEEVFPKFRELSEVRQRVMVDMMFNLGRAKFEKFEKMIAAVKRGEYDTAADEMKKSLWHDQVKTRAVRLEGMMRDDKDQE
jgi:GH24 family phage-related lysozyme (muramidase)